MLDPQPLDALTFLERVAAMSEAVAWQAGVGGCETAGAIISYLSAHPDKLGAFMERSFCDLVEDPVNLHREGRLSWLGSDGKIWNGELV